MMPERTCYQDSSHYREHMAVSFEDAEQKCQALGSRLIQIRSKGFFDHLEKIRPSHYVELYASGIPQTVVAIGMKYVQKDGDTTKNLYYK